MVTFDGHGDQRQAREALRRSCERMLVENVDVDVDDHSPNTVEIVFKLDALHGTKPPCIVRITPAGGATEGDLHLVVEIETLDRPEPSIKVVP
jgi:hypothetical protein